MMDILFYGIGITIFAIFIAWVFIVDISHVTMAKIKERLPAVYEKVLAKRDVSWVERRLYSPADVGIQLRLYKAIYLGEAQQVMGLKLWCNYVRLVRFFVFGLLLLIIFMALFVAVFLK